MKLGSHHSHPPPSPYHSGVTWRHDTARARARKVSRFLNVKLEGQSRFTVHRRGNQDIPDLIGESDCDWHSIIEQARIEVNLRQSHNVGQNAP
jgi:hypothetical protein